MIEPLEHRRGEPAPVVRGEVTVAHPAGQGGIRPFVPDGWVG
ncbi:hypothetical protein [Terrabacter sp. Soil810]|nr:hypothetical protein [Terrabacter sp. Soil810]